MEKVVWKGQSGKEYTFDVYSLNTAFNEVRCVYIYTKIADGEWKAVYVGQTSQLGTRLGQHSNGNGDSDKCIQQSRATHLHVHVLTPESSRLNVETDIRNNYKWSCNMQ